MGRCAARAASSRVSREPGEAAYVAGAMALRRLHTCTADRVEWTPATR